MNRMRQRVEPLEQRRRRSIEKFVANAEDAGTSGGAGLKPTSSKNDFVQRHAVACATPGSHEDFRIQLSNLGESNLLAGFAHELSAGSLN